MAPAAEIGPLAAWLTGAALLHAALSAQHLTDNAGDLHAVATGAGRIRLVLSGSWPGPQLGAAAGCSSAAWHGN